MPKQIAKLVWLYPKTLEEYLNDYFSKGYRLISLTRCSENEYIIILEVDDNA